MSARDQFRHETAADVAGAASNEHFHGPNDTR
jgi:hypothetical protein